MSLGFREAGFDVVQAYDFNRHAVESHARNLGPHVQEVSIAEDLDIPPCDVIVGGPPCQGFSSAGLRRDGDHRNTLVSVFAKIIVKHRPRAFVFENVEGFLTGEGGARVLDLLEPVIAAGYRVHLRKVNAANYGVPQHRKRVIGFGFLHVDSAFPEPTHRAHGAPGALLAATHHPATPTLLDALSGLPAPSATKPGKPQGHIAGRLRPEDANRMKSMLPGNTMRDLPEEMWHESYKRRANRRVMDGTPTERRGGAPCGLRRLVGSEPSKAITSFARNEFVHPTEHRFLTLRECARIQTFPDWFEFMGSQSDQALLIGNAVPPRFAEVIARHVLRHLVAPGRAHAAGALLSFVPTGSTGMSPALQKTTSMVHSRFANHEEVDGQAQLKWATAQTRLAL
jgi:DNA (cytosine-5)-methyltransferase 1